MQPRTRSLRGPRRRTRASILLVTLDTTRADSIGPDAKGVETPAFNCAGRPGPDVQAGLRYGARNLPSHARC